MATLQTRLDQWVSAQLITAEQATQIAHFEETRSPKTWVLTAFMLFGILLVGIGVISVIAANWHAIPAAFKLGANMVALVATAGAGVWLHMKDRHLPLEGVLFLFMALCMASIGLVAQVYHSSGELYTAALIWCGMTVGVAALSRLALLPLLWGLALLGGGVSWLMDTHILPEDLFTFLFFMLPLPLAFVSLLLYAKGAHSAQSRAFALLTLLTFCGVLAFLDVFGSPFNLPPQNWVLTLFAALVSGLACLLAWLPSLKFSQRLLGGCTLAVYSSHVLLLMFDLPLPFLAALLPLFSLLLLALLAASAGYKNWFKAFFILACLRCVDLYWQAFGGLLATGIGFIFSGIWVLVAVFLLHKYWKNINTTVERWVI